MPNLHPETSTADREIVISRILNAPRELVFKAFGDVDNIGRWWGPKGFTLTTYSMDFRPGGVWRLVLHGPDGRDYQNRIVYREIVEPELIVADHDDGGDKDIPPGCGRKYITFEPAPGDPQKTKLTLRMVFPSPEERQQTQDTYGAMQGGIETIGRLADYLGPALEAPPAMTLALPDARSCLFVRPFRAPASRVFDALTRPEHLRHWLGCGSARVTACDVDLQVGGRYRYVVEFDPAGSHAGTCTITGTYQAIERPGRLVYTQAFAAEGFPPDEANVTVTLEEQDGLTLMTVRTAYVSTAVREQHLTAGVAWGAAAAYDRLESMLNSH